MTCVRKNSRKKTCWDQNSSPNSNRSVKNCTNVMFHIEYNIYTYNICRKTVCFPNIDQVFLRFFIQFLVIILHTQIRRREPGGLDIIEYIGRKMLSLLHKCPYRDYSLDYVTIFREISKNFIALCANCKFNHT